MSLLDDIKAKADTNGDGKIDQNDLETLRNDQNGGVIDKLKAMADRNADSKLDIDDLKSFDFGDFANDAKSAFEDIKKKVF